MDDDRVMDELRAAFANEDTVEHWNLETGEQDLLDAILAEGSPGGEQPRGWRARLWPRPAASPRLGIAAVGTIAAVAVALTLFLGGGANTTNQSFAEAAVRVAEANPRLLVGAPGWTITRADQFAPSRGEVEFSDGTHRLTMTWLPADEYQDKLRDRSELPEVSMPLAGLGSSRTIRYSGDEYATLLEPEGPVFLEVRATLPESDYARVVESLEAVDVDTWLAAMPADVVQPGQRSQAVDEIAADMPLPPGLDLDAWRDQAGVASHYQLVVGTSSLVACGWLDQWAEAVRTNDESSAEEAVAAMQTSRDWRAVRDIQHEGGYAGILWEIADWMRDDRRELLLGPSGFLPGPNGQTYEFGPKYASALSCDSEYKRPEEGSSG